MLLGHTSTVSCDYFLESLVDKQMCFNQYLQIKLFGEKSKTICFIIAKYPQK